MAINISFHGANVARGGAGDSISVVGKATSIASVSDGAASSAAAIDGLVRIAATTASLIQIGPAATNGNNGEYFPAGHVEFRYVRAGDKVGVSAG